MPDPSILTTASGQLGPKCAGCARALKFAESLVINDSYHCLPCYEKITGANSASEPKQVGGLSLD
ncbi:MAG TPA: hypothetical protein QF641_03930 [Candidatus Thalassarchaeaceae archaeon]|nr:hypothetical protein [Candidatus Thalassarchaeaceae archaeon]